MTNDDRSKICMLIRKKNDDKLIKNRRVTSVMDVFPTLIEILNAEDDFDEAQLDLDGSSFFGNRRQKIVIEDHAKFLPNIGHILERWAVRDDSFFYFDSLQGNALLKVLGDNNYELLGGKNNIPEEFCGIVDEYRLLLEDVSVEYKENKKAAYMMSKYARLRDGSQYVCHSDGSKRPKRKGNERRTLMNCINIILNGNRYIRW